MGKDGEISLVFRRKSAMSRLEVSTTKHNYKVSRNHAIASELAESERLHHQQWQTEVQEMRRECRRQLIGEKRVRFDLPNSQDVEELQSLGRSHRQLLSDVSEWREAQA